MTLKDTSREFEAEGLSFPEIGQRLGKSADACRMLLARALAALTMVLEETRESEGEV